MNAGIGTLQKSGQFVWRAFQYDPFLGSRRNGKGIILVSRTPEDWTINKIAGRGSLLGIGIHFYFNGGVIKTLLIRQKNGSLIVGAVNFNVIILRLVIANEIIIEFRLGPTRRRIREVVLIKWSRQRLGRF